MKILLYTDLTIREGELFWHRDLGLLTQAFRELSHEACLVVHPTLESASKIKNQKSKIKNDPVIWASPSDVCNPSWWQSQKPDLIILGLWTRPKYDLIRRAALSATPRVIERADSDGMRTASCGLRIYANRRYDFFRDRTLAWPQPASILISCLYSATSVLACPWMEKRIARTLRLIPHLAVETPGAAESWRALACRLQAATRVHHIPHPVQTELFRYHESGLKQKKVISVGRWQAYQKNLPFLLSTLRVFLERHPDWSAMVVGSGLKGASPQPRIDFIQNLASPELAEQMKLSKIFLFASRYESFLLSGAEALIAGCSVVGPETLVATQQLVEIQGCAPTSFRNPLERLEAERQAWEKGNRDPSKISKRARAEFSSHAVAQRFISLAGPSS